MDNRAEQSLATRFERLREERARLAEVVAAYRIVRDSRFARVADLTLALKRTFRRIEEPPALAILDLPPFSAPGG